MSLLDRILPWQRSRTRRLSLEGEARVTRDALAANIAGLARAMEERFVSLSERIDGVREAQAVEAAQAADALGERVDGALAQFRAVLDGRIDGLTAQVSTLRDGQEFASILRELKRDFGAQISLASFETAAEIRQLVGDLERAAPVPGVQPASGAGLPTG